MNVNEFGFRKVTQPVEYFLALGGRKFGQQLQDFSFAHGWRLLWGHQKASAPTLQGLVGIGGSISFLYASQDFPRNTPPGGRAFPRKTAFSTVE
jgi:hypothetical protein